MTALRYGFVWGFSPAPALAHCHRDSSSSRTSVLIKSLSCWNNASCGRSEFSVFSKLDLSCSARVTCTLAFEHDGPSSGFSDVLYEADEVRGAPRRTVAVFWDLDNKPPNSVPAYDAAVRLKKLAGEFGEVVDMVAYANQNAFSYVPYRVREERLDRKMLDRLEKQGVVKPDQPYICSMCGRKSKTNLDLKKHFKQLHERERNKRVSRMKQLKGRKRIAFSSKVADREVRYKEAARTLITPKVGYGLAGELKRAGVHVRTVEKKPQAADEALLRHMNYYLHRGIGCICLVSDDSDFRQVLEAARKKRVCTVVIGDTGVLRSVADTNFSWEDVASGRALLTANSTLRRWAEEDALRAELLTDDEFDNEFDDDVDVASFSDDNEEEFHDFQGNVTGTRSVFADDEDGYISEEEDNEGEEESYRGWDLDEVERLNSEININSRTT